MRLLVSAVLGALLVAAATAQAPAPTTAAGAAMKHPIQVKLNPQPGSTEAGTATLLDGAKGLIVRLRVAGGPEGTPQPAHIHTGTCDNLGGVKYPLKSVTNGTSETVIPDVTLATFSKGQWAINVHKSTSDLKTYVACGNISQNANK